MSVTRFFPWPTVGDWLDQRIYGRYDFGLGHGAWSAQQQLTLELALNGYAIRSTVDTITVRVVRNQPRPDWAGEP